MWKLIYQLAGIVGVDPGPFTLAELIDMVDGRQRDDWERHSALLCLIAIANRGSKQKEFKPQEFNPFAVKRKPQHIQLNKKNMHLLKKALNLKTVKVGKGKNENPSS